MKVKTKRRTSSKSVSKASAGKTKGSVHLITVGNKYRPAKRYVSKPFDISVLDHHYTRADIEFHGIDHSEASYTAHVFVNNPKADAQTPRLPEKGYGGRFHVFGHGGCYGDEGHCEVSTERRPYDPRPSHPLAKALKIVIATEAINNVPKDKPLTITVIPLVSAATNKCNIEEVFHCSRIRIITYR